MASVLSRWLPDSDSFKDVWVSLAKWVRTGGSDKSELDKELLACTGPPATPAALVARSEGAEGRSLIGALMLLADARQWACAGSICVVCVCGAYTCM
jgi:hypothetical protein